VTAGTGRLPALAIRHARVFLVVMLLPFARVTAVRIHSLPELSAASKTIIVVAALVAMVLQRAQLASARVTCRAGLSRRGGACA